MNCPRLLFSLWLVALTVSAWPPAIQAQPILLQPNIRPLGGSGVSNLRVIDQASDGSEVLLGMDALYDGFGGNTALVVPVIEKKDQKGVSRWFGADPVTIGIGKSPISIKVKYFNDEEGVPPELTTDRIRVLVLNSSATAIITSSINLKTIKWGHPNAKPLFTSTLPELAAVPSSDAASVQRASDAAARAQQEALQRAQAEERARSEALTRQAARIKAEEDARRLSEQRRLAEERAAAEARAREQARLQAETEARVREEARLKAEAEEKARREAEAKALAEAQAREEARLKAEAEARRLAEEKRLADERARVEAEAQLKARLAAEARAREEARLKAEAEARRLAEEKRLAEERAAIEARARELARLKAEAEEKVRRDAEAKAQAEARAREEARLKAEAETRRLAEEKRLAEERAVAEAEAHRLAEEQAQVEAQARARAEVEAKLREAERLRAEQLARGPSTSTAAVTGSQAKTRVINFDIVNRSLDRSQMTFGVEFDYRDELSRPALGLEVARTGDSQASRFFQAPMAEIKKSSQKLALFPVRFQPPETASFSSFSTDRVLVYLQDAQAQRFELLPVTMVLMWRPPNATDAPAPSQAGTLQLDEFKQSDFFSGYVTVKYTFAADSGKIRARLYDTANPRSAAWFKTVDAPVKAGSGVQLVPISVLPDADSPGDLIRVDMLEVELLDDSGAVVATLKKQSPMTWARPK